MALALLVRNHCRKENIKLVALSVDHGLREKSENEAKQVAKWLDALEIDHHILTWTGHKPDTNIQDEARKARYNLMGQWCADNNIKHLFLAHHKDDQAETFLIRLFRGSGIDGLSAMEKVAEFPMLKRSDNYPKIYRPLLDVPKKRLDATLRQAGQAWIEDPSNENRKFTRVQIRELLKSSEIEGLDADRLASTAGRMRRVRSLLEEMTAEAESDYVIYNDFGYASLNSDFHKNMHEEISLRLLTNILKKVGGNPYPPRHHKLESLLHNLRQGQFSGQTLSGVILFQLSGDEIIFAREIKEIALETNISKAKQTLWDNRFLLDIGGVSGKIVPMNEQLVKKIVAKTPEFKQRLNALFAHHRLRDRIVPSLPCIIDLDGDLLLPDIVVRGLELHELNGFSVVFKK